MSYSTIMYIWPNEKVEQSKELSNSWGTAPVVWNALAKKYLCPDSYLAMLDDIWPMYLDKNIPIHHRAVLMMTFDLAYVARKNYKRAAGDIRLFLKDFPQPAGRANHWPTIAALLEATPDAPGIAIWCTSVSRNPWQGTWNDEKDDYDSVDWSKIDAIYEILEGEQ